MGISLKESNGDKTVLEKDSTMRESGFPPAYFPLTMATGIVSLALFFQGWTWAAQALLWLNLLQYLVIWLASANSWLRNRRRFMLGCRSHLGNGVLLSSVAGTCVVGVQWAQLSRWSAGSEYFWMLGAGLWVLLIYAYFLIATVSREKPDLANGMRGSSLLIVVATESLCVLAVEMAKVREDDAHWLLPVAGAMFLVGAAIYFIFIALILYRWMFLQISATEMTPDYWINMGALAIACLAGGSLLDAGDAWNFLTEIRSFLLGLTLLFWALATWWIPLLIAMGFWRHLWCRQALHYGPGYWSLVFPLGMYSAASWKLGSPLHWQTMLDIAAAFALIAAFAWSLTFMGMLGTVMRRGTR